MPLTSWVSLVNNEEYSQTNTGSALSSSTSLTDISPGGATSGQAHLIPGSSLYQGLQLRISARGVFSTTGSPQLTLGIYLGGVAGTALGTSTFTASAGATNAVWSVRADVRCESTGTSASLRTLGEIQGIGSSNPIMLPQTGVGTASVASGNSLILTLGAQWGTSSASNSIQVLEYLVEQLN